MAAGQPSIYGPVLLWGPVTMGSMACVYGPASANRTQITGVSVVNTLASANAVSIFVGPSGTSGMASGAVAYNASIPATGVPVPLIPTYAPPLMITNSQVVHVQASVASGTIMFASGIEMQ